MTQKEYLENNRPVYKRRSRQRGNAGKAAEKSELNMQRTAAEVLYQVVSNPPTAQN